MKYLIANGNDFDAGKNRDENPEPRARTSRGVKQMNS